MKIFFASFYLTAMFLNVSAQVDFDRAMLVPHNPSELKVGDKMADISLGTVINNHTGKTRFSDFKGKLVILDFWNTGCDGCIALFPHMEELQKRFKDKIQIFIVNAIETQQQISERLLNVSNIYHKDFKLPDLPSIVNAKTLLKLFPHFPVPHHVWIDGEGIIRVIGLDLNTNIKKIEELLEGKRVTFVSDANNTYYFRKKIPYYKFIGDSTSAKLTSESSISLFNNEYAPEGAEIENLTDSLTNTNRNTYINMPLIRLYTKAFNKSKEENIKKNNVIYTNSKTDFVEFISLQVKDTLKVTSYFLHHLDLDDEKYMRSRFCYEQILPKTVSESKREAFMLEDLNRFFCSFNQLSGSIELQKTQCWVITKIPTDNTTIGKGDEQKEYNRNDSMIDARNHRVIKYTVEGAFQKYKDANISRSLFILDETGFDNKPATKMIIPELDIYNPIEYLKKALNKYGLDIHPEEREFKFMVIRDNCNSN